MTLVPPSTAPEPESDGITLAAIPPLELEIQNNSGTESVRQNPVEPPSPTATVRVQTAKPRTAEQRSVQRMTLWDIKQLKSGNDPLGKGLAILLERGARHALFLSLVAAPAGSPVPHFLASAAIAPRERLKLWTGLRWDPTIVPSLWNLFVRTGHAELPPPGAETDISSNRNVVRAAFGVGHDEWLLLVRTGPVNQCRGVLAVVSDRSMLQALVAASPLLGSPIGAATPSKKAS
jgi:hypothetical protein